MKKKVEESINENKKPHCNVMITCETGKKLIELIKTGILLNDQENNIQNGTVYDTNLESGEVKSIALSKYLKNSAYLLDREIRMNLVSFVETNDIAHTSKFLDSIKIAVERYNRYNFTGQVSFITPNTPTDLPCTIKVRGADVKDDKQKYVHGFISGVDLKNKKIRVTSLPISRESGTFDMKIKVGEKVSNAMKYGEFKSTNAKMRERSGSNKGEKSMKKSTIFETYISLKHLCVSNVKTRTILTTTGNNAQFPIWDAHEKIGDGKCDNATLIKGSQNPKDQEQEQQDQEQQEQDGGRKKINTGGSAKHIEEQIHSALNSSPLDICE